MSDYEWKQVGRRGKVHTRQEEGDNIPAQTVRSVSDSVNLCLTSDISTQDQLAVLGDRLPKSRPEEDHHNQVSAGEED